VRLCFVSRLRVEFACSAARRPQRCAAWPVARVPCRGGHALLAGMRSARPARAALCACARATLDRERARAHAPRCRSAAPTPSPPWRCPPSSPPSRPSALCVCARACASAAARRVSARDLLLLRSRAHAARTPRPPAHAAVRHVQALYRQGQEAGVLGSALAAVAVPAHARGIHANADSAHGATRPACPHASGSTRAVEVTLTLSSSRARHVCPCCALGAAR
jgi:hypothetical protein